MELGCWVVGKAVFPSSGGATMPIAARAILLSWSPGSRRGGALISNNANASFGGESSCVPESRMNLFCVVQLSSPHCVKAVLQEMDCKSLGLCCVLVVYMGLCAIDPSTADEVEKKTACASGSGPPAFALF